jgi:integrase
MPYRFWGLLDSCLAAAVLFLYSQVLNQELPWLSNVEQAKVSKRLPVVLTVNETRALLDRLKGVHRLQANLLYGTGMRLMEVMRLRVKDIDFERKEILIRDGKGAKDRVTMLPVTLADLLQQHLQTVKALHDADLQGLW